MEHDVAQHRMTRRKAVQLATVGSGAAVFGGGVASMAIAARQIDSTPPAPPAPTFASPIDPIFDLAVRLNYDQQAIFDFVRDEIHYETYAGVLRGAKGTLWARAGNSADQAVLLAELLTVAQIHFRFISGPLDIEAEQVLTSYLTPISDLANAAYDAALVAAARTTFGNDADGATPPALSAAELQTVETITAQATTVIEAAALASETTLSIIKDALATASIDLPPLPTSVLSERERSAHCWVQVSDGPLWLDLDPTLPPDAPALTAADTFDSLPADWLHQLSFRIAADDLSGSSLIRRDVVTFTATSRDLVDTPVAINLAPAEALTALGDSLNELLGGQQAIYPSIFANGVSVDGSQPLVFTTSGDSATGLLDSGTPTPGAADGETVAVWLIVDIVSPDQEPITIERALLDRVPPLDRAAGIIVPEAILPIQFTPSALEGDGVDTVAQFNRLLVLYVDTARIPNVHALARAVTDEMLGALHLFGSSLASTRDGLGIEHETAAGVWSYPSAPNITAFTFTAQGNDQGAGAIAIDLIYRQRLTHAFSDALDDTAPHPLVLSGVLDAVSETVLLSPEMRGEIDSASPTAISVVNIFELAAADGIGISVVTSPADLAELSLDDAARVRIEQSLSNGNLVIVPDQPVDMGGGVSGWWIVDPATGRTTDLLEDGTGGASTEPGTRAVARAQDTLAWYARWAEWITRNRVAFSCIGNLIGLVATQAGAIIAAAHGSGAGFGVGEVASVGQAARVLGACAA